MTPSDDPQDATGDDRDDVGGERRRVDADESADDLDDALASLLDGYGLKDERRTGWQLRGVTEPESVAAHSWGVSLLCLVFGPEAGAAVDVDRALRLAVVHDLAEARTGDVPTRADPAAEGVDEEAKLRRERRAMADLGAPLGDVVAAWEAYEARDTETARFVKDMDLVDMCLQALVYEREGRYDPGHGDAFEAYDRLDEFFATAEPRLTTDVGRRLFERVRTRYAAAKRERAAVGDGNDLTDGDDGGGRNSTDGDDGEGENSTDGDEPMDL